MEWILLAVVGGAFLAVCIAAITTQLKNFRKLETQMSALAEHFGIELTVPAASMMGLYRRNPTLYGRYRGRELAIYPKGYGMDNTRQTDIAISIATRAPKEIKFTLARQHALDKLGQVARLKYTPSEDPEFDKAFSLRSNQPEAIAAFFNRDRRKLLEKEWGESKGFLELSAGVMLYLEFGLPYDEAKRLHLQHMTDLLCDLAEEVDMLSVTQ